jgi:hypothetical protein
MPRGGPQRGDLTGQERQRLAEENAAELAERQKEIGLVNQVEMVEEREGIWDPATGTIIDMPADAQAKIEALSEPVTVDVDPILDPSLKVPGYDPMKDLQATQVQQRPKNMLVNAMQVEDLGPEPMVVEDEWRVIRVNTDIEQMTYGAGNDLTFMRGFRYRVPKDLYNWLESRGVVYH